MGKRRCRYLFFLFLVCFQFLALSFYVVQRREEKLEVRRIENFIGGSLDISEEQENYWGVLEIPKINLKKGFYNLTSKENQVDKNIQVIETSLMPDEKYSNLILAAHSGNSKISYFKNLYQLKIGDVAYVYYGGIRYVYCLIDVYDVEKNGTVSIHRERDQTNLILITCDKKNKDTQNVYILKLISD